LPLVRILAAFLAVEVADTPLFCADERPVEDAVAAVRDAPASGSLQSQAGSPEESPAFCFCPCHLTFDSEGAFAVRASDRFRPTTSLPGPAEPVAVPHSLDHPPRNLG
jgi:hypothetical protein